VYPIFSNLTWIAEHNRDRGPKATCRVPLFSWSIDQARQAAFCALSGRRDYNNPRGSYASVYAPDPTRGNACDIYDAMWRADSNNRGAITLAAYSSEHEFCTGTEPVQDGFWASQVSTEDDDIYLTEEITNLKKYI